MPPTPKDYSAQNALNMPNTIYIPKATPVGYPALAKPLLVTISYKKNSFIVINIVFYYLYIILYRLLVKVRKSFITKILIVKKIKKQAY